ncbi:unnamed protein product [Dicrocoelium dendriticum]|nr:unnamed protein product [Dicrocoelium dendriticum]
MSTSFYRQLVFREIVASEMQVRWIILVSIMLYDSGLLNSKVVYARHFVYEPYNYVQHQSTNPYASYNKRGPELFISRLTGSRPRRYSWDEQQDSKGME